MALNPTSAGTTWVKKIPINLYFYRQSNGYRIQITVMTWSKDGDGNFPLPPFGDDAEIEKKRKFSVRRISDGFVARKCLVGAAAIL